VTVRALDGPPPAGEVEDARLRVLEYEAVPLGVVRGTSRGRHRPAFPDPVDAVLAQIPRLRVMMISPTRPKPMICAEHDHENADDEGGRL
jgi:hypothetical protein